MRSILVSLARIVATALIQLNIWSLVIKTCSGHYGQATYVILFINIDLAVYMFLLNLALQFLYSQEFLKDELYQNPWPFKHQLTAVQRIFLFRNSI
jgi:hypothetical protein